MSASAHATPLPAPADWRVVVGAPLRLTNQLPMAGSLLVWEQQAGAARELVGRQTLRVGSGATAAIHTGAPRCLGWGLPGGQALHGRRAICRAAAPAAWSPRRCFAAARRPPTRTPCPHAYLCVQPTCGAWCPSPSSPRATTGWSPRPRCCRRATQARSTRRARARNGCCCCRSCYPAVPSAPLAAAAVLLPPAQARAQLSRAACGRCPQEPACLTRTAPSCLPCRARARAAAAARPLPPGAPRLEPAGRGVHPPGRGVWALAAQRQGGWVGPGGSGAGPGHRCLTLGGEGFEPRLLNAKVRACAAWRAALRLHKPWRPRSRRPQLPHPRVHPTCGPACLPPNTRPF